MSSPFVRHRSIIVTPSAIDTPAAHYRRVILAIGAAMLVWGAAAALLYHRAGLTLSHYDARAHLVVARRILDSLTPGWIQIGAVWLPLPHLLNMLPVQVDAFYRTGASAVAMSVIAFAAAGAAIGWLVLRTSGSRAGAIAGSAVFALNPAVLYLQATPMTEPLLLGFTLTGVAALTAWASLPSRAIARTAGLLLALACLTRYEAWPVTGAALMLAGLAVWRHGRTPLDAARLVSSVAAFPMAAIVAFLVLSKLTIGKWFVTGGFYVPDNPATGRLLGPAPLIGWGLAQLAGHVIIVVAAAGVVWMIVRVATGREPARALVPVALIAVAALPWYAFFQGHPFRIRYMVPLIAPVALFSGVLVGLVPRFRAILGLAVVIIAAVQAPPLGRASPMIREASFDRDAARARRAVTDCLVAEYGGETVMASMGSLAHYMHDLSAEGFHLRDFLHEGNDGAWIAALERPSEYAGWILIEEVSEGGDILSILASRHEGFLDGFVRACEGGGVALYRRTPPR